MEGVCETIVIVPVPVGNEKKGAAIAREMFRRDIETLNLPVNDPTFHTIYDSGVVTRELVLGVEKVKRMWCECFVYVCEQSVDGLTDDVEPVRLHQFRRLAIPAIGEG